MIVADSAAEGEAEEDGGSGLDPVLLIDGVDLFGDGAAFVGGDVTAVEAGGDLLVDGPVGE